MRLIFHFFRYTENIEYVMLNDGKINETSRIIRQEVQVIQINQFIFYIISILSLKKFKGKKSHYEINILSF